MDEVECQQQHIIILVFSWRWPILHVRALILDGMYKLTHLAYYVAEVHHQLIP